MTAGTLIVGGGQAGVQIATSLRERGYEGELTIVGCEDALPYARPPLSKQILLGTAGPESLPLRPAAFFESQRIDLRLDDRVVSLAANGSTGGVATTARGEAIAYAQLALATGARPRRLDVPGGDLDGVCYLRSLHDAIALKEYLYRAQDVVIVGGGFVGLEAAAAARAADRNVTIVEAADRLMGRAVSPSISGFYLDAHRQRGANVLLGTAVAALEGVDGYVTAVHCTDGQVLPADVVVVGVGIEARTSLAEQIGIACDRGIVVDNAALTSRSDTVAAGDCTARPHPMSGKGLVRIESVNNAVSQARVAAATLLGDTAPHPETPWFWSDQFDLKLQITGLLDGFDEQVIRGSRAEESFTVLSYAGDRLVAAESVNATGDFVALRAALTRGISIDRRAAGDASTSLRDLVTARVR